MNNNNNNSEPHKMRDYHSFIHLNVLFALDLYDIFLSVCQFHSK